MPSPTPEQRVAIEHAGQLLVVAGAGAGKTSTLVERCVAQLLHPDRPVSPENVLMVTFTKAAAAEMRRRIRERLEEERAESVAGHRLEETIALLESARISTLHAFCLDLVRENFHVLDLDPRMTPLEGGQRQALLDRTMDERIEVHYARGGAVCEFIRHWAGGREETLRQWTVKLHDYAQTLPSPERWLAERIAFFENPAPEAWDKLFLTELPGWAAGWVSRTPLFPKVAAREKLGPLLGVLSGASSREKAGGILRELVQVCEDKSLKRGSELVKTLGQEAQFLAPLCPVDGVDGLAEDWEWCRVPMRTLLSFVREFGDEFARVKREMSLIDFHDMDQFALRLLWNEDRATVTPLAESWRSRLEMVLVDEYQDINEAQDAILRALGREKPVANRCLVGDVKQSIYGFRLAAPRVFLNYEAAWSGNGEGRIVYLSDNFRSHQGVVDFVNAVFRRLMRRRIGGVEYTPEVELRFGAAEYRPAHAVVEGAPPCVEMTIFQGGGKSDAEGDDAEAGDSADGVEAEALWIGRRLRSLREEGLLASASGKPVDWRDMVILLRAPGSKREVFAKAFHELGIPLETSRSGFLETTEVLDLENLLRILDNPMQDLPLLAVLRSPFGGLTQEDLVEIRLARREGLYWTALQVYGLWGAEPGLRDRVTRFLRAHELWRRRARQEPLSACLESILDETFYREWVQAGDRPAERLANVVEFIRMTRDFDLFQREGLFRFLQHLDRQRELEAAVEPAFAGEANAVKLMSIHQSKGLEFSIVVAGELGKQFNLDDQRSEILLDDNLGVCPMVRPVGTERAYPSLALWLGRRRKRRDVLGEELRLLYVAITRARDRLILCGSAKASQIERKWGERVRDLAVEDWIEAANSPMDWAGCWLMAELGVEELPSSGSSRLLSWSIVPTDQIPKAAARVAATDATMDAAAGEIPPDFVVLRDLERRLSWAYPFAVAEETPAKTSVSAIRRRMDEEGDEARPARFLLGSEEPSEEGASSGLSAAETGVAHHLFLQWARIELLATVQGCFAESRRLVSACYLSEPQAAALNLEALAGFWASDFGSFLAANCDKIERELPFTARFDPCELVELGLMESQPALAGEFILVQGVVDLAVFFESEIWIVDFKTDRVPPAGLAEKIGRYRPQIMTYARALEKAHGRPVTQGYLHFLSCDRSERVL